jgi:hypothetical protein
MIRYFDTRHEQSSRHSEGPCGDLVLTERTPYHTTLLVCDGIGSGAPAAIAAEMNAARIMHLLRQGRTPRQVFERLVMTMSDWREHGKPFAAFTIARLFTDGSATVLTYENPPPVLFSAGHCTLPRMRPVVCGTGIALECQCRLQPADTLYLMTDGITQSGIGVLKGGWDLPEIARYIESCTGSGTRSLDAVRFVHDMAIRRDRGSKGDDRTILAAATRRARMLSVMTGPPENPANDDEAVREFLGSEGTCVVCGATTANIVSRVLGTQLFVDEHDAGMFTPPRYTLRGVDMATEGLMTLNQVYHIVQDDLRQVDDRSAAVELAGVLQKADYIRFIVGTTENPANNGLIFRKQGLLPRKELIPLLKRRLEDMGHVVSIEWV